MSQADQSSSSGAGPKRTRRKGPSSPLQLSRSLQIAMSLPVLFSAERRELGVSELADLIDFSRPTTHRYASTFVRLGFLEQRGSRKYRLAPGAAMPGLSLVGVMRRALLVSDVLEELREVTGYTVSLGTMRHNGVTYLHRLHGHRQGQWEADLELRAGALIPLYCSALGKALLATFPDERRRWLIKDIDFVPQGPRSIVTHRDLIAQLQDLDVTKPIVSNEELAEGARSIAMYVPRPNETRPIGIEVIVPSRHMTVAQIRKQIGPHIVHAANLIAQVPHRPILAA